MTLIDETLGDLVTADPRRAAVLEKLGIDYCCNGHRTVAAASADADLDPSEVLRALDLGAIPLTTSPAPGDNASLAHDIVDTHHAYLWDEMPRLLALVEKVHRVHGERHSELAAVLTTYRAAIADLDPHMTREERKVFPAISRLEKGGAVDAAELTKQLTLLRQEHDAVGGLLREVRRLTSDFAVPEDACTSYRLMLKGLEEMELDLHEHIHKENNILFTRVDALLH